MTVFRTAATLARCQGGRSPKVLGNRDFFCSVDKYEDDSDEAKGPQLITFRLFGILSAKDCSVMWTKFVLPRALRACWRLRRVTDHLRMFSSDAAVGNEDVILETKEHVGIITLNRPKALNSLNLNMIRKIHPVLTQWEKDSNIGAIIIKGAGDKAFCAGGDVRAVAEAGMAKDRLTKDFFKEEYRLNNTIGTLKTPYVALIDGIIMGGGVGLSVHGHFRAGTERTLFAMPETAIGLFPDVGGSFFLPKLQGELGTFLALTGERLKGYDVNLAGVATHYISSDKVSELEKDLTSMEMPRLKTILQTVEAYHRDSTSTLKKEFSLAPYLDTINSARPREVSELFTNLVDDCRECIRGQDGPGDLFPVCRRLTTAMKDDCSLSFIQCFNKNSVEEILTALEEDGSEWAKSKVDVMNKVSPTSLKVTLKQLREGTKLRTLFECLTMEYRLSQRFMEDKDFYEGIRAVLVDKDNNPKWTPDTLQEVTAHKVESYFTSLGEEELEF